MARTFLASASASVGLTFTTRRPWFIDRTSGDPLLLGEICVLDLAFRSGSTTNHRFNDENSCWTNLVRAVDYEDQDNATYILAESDPLPSGRVRGYVWGNEVPAFVRNYAQEATDPTPVGRPCAVPFAAASSPDDYQHDMRHLYVATFQADASVTSVPGPNTNFGKYTNHARYVGLLGETLAQGTPPYPPAPAASLVTIAFDGFFGFSTAGVT